MEKKKTIQNRNIKDYDFKHPDKLSKDQLRTLQSIYELFARLMTTSLSAQLRTMARVHVSSVSQLLYGEFMKNLPNPTTLAIIDMDPLKGEALIEIDPTITFNIIERLLGGKGESPTSPARELTDIELTLIETTIERMLLNLREAWASIIDLRPKLSAIEANPLYTQIVPSTDVVVATVLEVKIGEVEGRINICIPFAVMEPVVEKFSAHKYVTTSKSVSQETSAKLRERMNLIEVPVSVELGTAEVLMSDIYQLQPGDVIKLKAKVNDDLILKINDTPKFKCRPGLSGSKIAVQITGLNEYPIEIY